MSGPDNDGDSSGRVDPLGLARHERYATHRQREWGFQWDTRTPPHQVGSMLQYHLANKNKTQLKRHIISHDYSSLLNRRHVSIIQENDLGKLFFVITW